jgi:cytochrome c-type biogenesis protein CcmH/NrfG
MDQSVRNDLEVLLRTMFRRVPETHWQELVQQLSSNAGFGGTVSNVTAVSPEATDTPFHFSYSYNRKDYSDWENRRITPPFPPIMLPGLRDDQAALEEPLWLGAPGQSVLEAAVEMPRGYRPELPPAVDVERDFAEYHASYAFKDGVLSAGRRLVIKTREVQVTELAEYKSFRKAIDDDQQRYIVLASEGQSPARTSPASIGALAWQLPDSQNPSAIHAEQIARSDVMQQDLNGAISSMQAAVEADPKFVRGWVLLGTLHMTSGDTDAGLRALRTAVDRDPQNFIPRKMLGFGFMGANRPDEAIEVWRELLKIAPQDYDAVANLSELLLRAKRYTEAIPVLESSLKANPQDLPMWLSLGSAYLRSGKEEQGVAAFESALKLKPGAEVENDFGYELAEANVRLTDALRLAQKAVGTEEDESSKVRLSALKQEDLLHPSILAAYWDTLGWVYFKMAKLPESEQYLSAAWELSQSATTADHLSQVYEREHKVEAAGRMHRLAAAAGFHPLRSEGQPLRLRRGTPQPLVEGGAELSQMRTTRLGRILPGTATAEFFLMFAPGPKVQEVKFISGSEKARAAEKILISTHFRVVFPDGSNARLLRRGILACYPTSACSFVLFPVSQVRSLN